MENFFDNVHRALRDKETLNFQITRDGERLKVVTQPLLGPAPESLDEEDEKTRPAAELRAALALPMLLQMLPAELDEQFGRKLLMYGEARAPIRDAFDTLMESLGETAKSARNTVAAKTDGKQTTGKGVRKPVANDKGDQKVEEGEGKPAVVAPAEGKVVNPASVL